MKRSKNTCVFQRFLILFVFVFSLPIFAQNVEPSDSVMSQLWESMSEEEKGAIFKEFLDSKFQSELLINLKNIDYEKNYIQGKRRLKKGIIFMGAGLTASALPLLFFISDDHDAYIGVILTGIPLWSAGGGFFIAGIPITITGASQIAKNKPYIAFSPNSIKFAMEF